MIDTRYYKAIEELQQNNPQGYYNTVMQDYNLDITEATQWLADHLKYIIEDFSIQDTWDSEYQFYVRVLQELEGSIII